MAHLRNNPTSHKPWEVLPPPHYPSQTQPAETPQERDHPSPEPPSLPQALDSSTSVDSLFIRICSRPSLTSGTCLDPADSRPSPCSAQGLRQRCRECQGTVGEGPGLPARTTVRGEGPRDRRQALSEHKEHGASHHPQLLPPPGSRHGGTLAPQQPRKGLRQILMEAEMPLP